MSIWSQTMRLPPEALRQVENQYNVQQFPIVVRQYLAGWIEDNWENWKKIDINNPAHNQYIQDIVMQFILEIETKASTFMNDEKLRDAGNRLHGAARQFKNNYLPNNPLRLLIAICTCINSEIDLVRHHGNMLRSQQPSSEMRSEPHTGIDQELELLSELTAEIAGDLQHMRTTQDSYAVQLNECTNVDDQLSFTQVNEMGILLQEQKKVAEHQLVLKRNELLHQRSNLIRKYQRNLDCLEKLLKRILHELNCWKVSQQKAGISKHFNKKYLDQIQKWCQVLMELLWMNRFQIKEYVRFQMSISAAIIGGIDVSPLDGKIKSLLFSLVNSSLVIEEQPPQVLKKGIKFRAGVRLLVGNTRNVNVTPPQVKVSIMNEVQINNFIRNNWTCIGEKSGELSSNKRTMEYHQDTEQLSARFTDMKITDIKRSGKKEESVVDEKYAFLFQSQINIGQGELLFKVHVFSLPVVVIVHTLQEPDAIATICWDNAFAVENRLPFIVPEKVPWPLVAEMLDAKFTAETDRGLTEDHLKFLACKVFQVDCASVQNFGSMMFSRSQFCKDNLPQKDFTFWQWFYDIMKVTRRYLHQAWNEGYVEGFIDRERTEELLKHSINGTFLLRFSDSVKGGVTIAWKHGDSTEGDQSSRVLMLDPWTHKNFAELGLPDVIADLNILRYLHPNIPKKQAFGKYCTPQANEQPKRNGYVMKKLVTQLPGLYPNNDTNHAALQESSPHDNTFDDLINHFM